MKRRGNDINRTDTARLEKESARMESKLDALRLVIAKERETVAKGKSKWRHGSDHEPVVRGYISQVSKNPSTSKPGSKGKTPGETTHVVSTLSPSSEPLRGRIRAHQTTSGGGQLSLKPNLATFVPLSKTVEVTDTNKTNPSCVLGGHLASALSMQARELQEIERFLSDIGLERYFKLFEEQGFDCMETVLCLTEEHLKEMGVPQGHRIKLLNRVAAQNSKNKEEKDGGNSEIQAPPTKPKVSFDETANKPVKGGSLLEGTFDENESSASFQEALASWRNPGSENSEPFSWGTLGSLDIQVATKTESPKSEMVSAQTEFSMSSLTKNSEKHCCYFCLKQFSGVPVPETCPIMKTEKSLCSEACRNSFLRECEEKRKKKQEREEMQEKILGGMRLREELLSGATSYNAQSGASSSQLGALQEKSVDD